MTEPYKVRDIQLAPQGQQKINWAADRMPVLASLVEKHRKEQPLKGHTVAGCLHVTKETAVLVHALKAVGANVTWSGCNPLSTHDDIAAALAVSGIAIYAWHGLNVEDFYKCIHQTLDYQPTLTLDDGADLIMTVHTQRANLAQHIHGGTEETTTGVHRLRAMAKDGKLLYPVMAVNDAITKWDFDNVYGTGQSSIDGILRATNILLAGKVFVVAGYGHCGRGVASRAQGMGAHTIVTEIDPTLALKAILDGHRVMTMQQAASLGDIFITATGMKDILVKEHFLQMKDGAILCNTGHYDCEINLQELKSIASRIEDPKPMCKRYLLKNNHRIDVLCDGRLINLSAAEGHPSEVMDMSFANQFLGMLKMAKEGKKLKAGIYDIELAQDHAIAHVKLQTMGVKIDRLSADQIKYATDYLAGT